MLSGKANGNPVGMRHRVGQPCTRHATHTRTLPAGWQHMDSTSGSTTGTLPHRRAIDPVVVQYSNTHRLTRTHNCWFGLRNVSKYVCMRQECDHSFATKWLPQMPVDHTILEQLAT